MPDSPIVHRTSFDVSWGDCDPAGIVFYPRYFSWFDQATHRLLTSVGLDHRTVTERWGVAGLSIVDARASFRRPATFGTRIEAETRLTDVGRSSLVLEHVLRDDGNLLVEGREDRVWVEQSAGDARSLRATPIPSEIRRRLEEA